MNKPSNINRTSNIPVKTVLKQVNANSKSTSKIKQLTPKYNSDKTKFGFVSSSKQINIFKEKPTQEDLDSRGYLANLREKPKLDKTKNFSIIFNRAQEIGKIYFTNEFYRKLFTIEFESACNSFLQWKKEQENNHFGYRSRRQPSFDINLSDGLSEIMTLIQTKPRLMLYLTDFIYFYISLIIIICKTDGNALSALKILQMFLNLNPTRHIEDTIIFGALVTENGSSDPIHSYSVQSLAILAKNNPSILSRIEDGCGCADIALAELCKSVISHLPSEMIHHTEIPEPKTLDEMQNFSEISSITGPEDASKKLQQMKTILESGHFPPKPINIVTNIIMTMDRLSSYEPVIISGFQCIKILLPQCIPPSPIILSQVLAFASHYPDQELTEGIIQDIFSNNFSVKVIVQSLEGSLSLVHQPNDAVNIINRFGTYAQAAISKGDLSPFYLSEIVNCLQMNELPIPDYLMQYKRDNLPDIETSIKKLLDPETVFDETERIVTSDNGEIIQHYPIYLQGYLKRAFVIFNELPAPGMQQQDADQILHQFSEMNDNELLNGKYSYENLAKQFKLLKEKSNVYE